MKASRGPRIEPTSACDPGQRIHPIAIVIVRPQSLPIAGAVRRTELSPVRWEGTEALAPGKHTIEYDFKYDGLGFATLAFNNISGIGRPGTGTLKVDGKVVSTQTLDRTAPLTLPWDETFDIGSDTGTPVDDKDYQVPFKFTGTIDKLMISIEPPKLTAADEQRLMEAAGRAADGAPKHLQRGPM